jgi:ABC-type nitrate/sulfonate/bicarbonate transport system substrate-binding protein
MSRRMLLAAAVALGFAVAALPAFAVADTKIVLQLDRPAQFEFAGYYAALWQGYYRAEGLDVDIKPGAPPGQMPIDPVRELTEGRARFGTGSARLLIRDAQGLPLLLLAPIFQTSGATVYYRADTDFSSPGALLNGGIGRLPASNILDIELRTALQSEGIDADKLHSVAIEPDEAVTALAQHTVDAVIGSAWQVPWEARERGLALKSFNPASYRTEFYGDSLFTLQRFAGTEPATVERFRVATLKGWEYALLHPDEMATRMAAELPQVLPVSDPPGFARYQAGVARKLTGYPAIPLGHSNPERWRRIEEAMTAVAAITRPADLGAFLYDPEEAARQSTDRRAWSAIAAAAPAFVLVAAGLVWSRRRQRLAVSGGIALSTGGRRPGHGIADNAVTLAEELRGIADRVEGALEHIRRQTGVQRRIDPFCAADLDGLEHLRTIIHRLAGTVLVLALNPTPIDLNATATAITRAIRRGLPRGVSLRLSLMPKAWLCRADPDAVMAAVLDLVKAAADDMASGGELVIGTRQLTIDTGAAAEMSEAAPGSYVRLTIRDSGPGLCDEKLDRIFNPQATARPAVAAALRLMRALGGFVRVESAEGIGTAVHLYFPRALEHGAGPREVDPDEATAQAAE